MNEEEDKPIQKSISIGSLFPVIDGVRTMELPARMTEIRRRYADGEVWLLNEGLKLRKVICKLAMISYENTEH